VFAQNEDFRLIDEFLAGDIASFEQLLKKYRKEIYYFALRLLGNPEDAEDVAQMAFVNVFRSLRNFKKQSQFKTWVYKIALNLCLNHLKKNKVTETEELDHTIASDDDTSMSMLEKEERHELLKAVEELPEKQRLTVILRTYQDLSYQEVSRILGCSEGAAKANFHFALQKLKKKLSKVYGL
jgi:RNA polymerase sigma-70 factor (ECF subfamily)